MDIFDAKISCKKCNVEMNREEIEKNGMVLRAMVCHKCGEKIIHPQDLNSLNHYNDLKGKTFSVKLRVVGNSHAVSIPKEIVDFMNEMNVHKKRMDEMVRLCFEDFRKLSLDFGDEEEDDR